jgi:hypothetical protein
MTEIGPIYHDRWAGFKGIIRIKVTSRRIYFHPAFLFHNSTEMERNVLALFSLCNGCLKQIVYNEFEDGTVEL